VLELLIQASALAGGCTLPIPKEMEPQLSHQVSRYSLRSSVPAHSCYKDKWVH